MTDERASRVRARRGATPKDRVLSPASVGESGVSHPVTAVLLNFRGYDTLLELVVLLFAMIGTWSVGTARGCAGNPAGPCCASCRGCWHR